MELTAFGKTQSLEQHLRDQITLCVEQGIAGESMFNVLNAALATIQCQGAWLLQAGAREKRIQQPAKPALKQYMIKGTIRKSRYMITEPEFFEKTMLTCASTRDEALSNFEKHWEDQCEDYCVSYSVIRMEIIQEI